MRIVVASCQAYRDTWGPFFQLFRKFWPDCKHPVSLVTDHAERSDDVPNDVQFIAYGRTWCGNLESFAHDFPSEPILMMQDDFWLNVPVNTDLVNRGLELINKYPDVGLVRLYPCPGADVSFNDEHFGFVHRSSRYRVSCQVSIWRPKFLEHIAINSDIGQAKDFERYGGPWAAENSPLEVMAFRREVTPWPMQYLCSAVTRGKYTPDAKKLCDQHGIAGDFSRGFIAA